MPRHGRALGIAPSEGPPGSRPTAGAMARRRCLSRRPVLLAIVVTSYYQTIHGYPSGGGAYIVAHDNLGVWPGLTAGAALLTDYVLTVAVSTTAGIAAVTSAFPALSPYRVELCLLAIVLIAVALFMPPGLPRGTKGAKFTEVFSRDARVNRLSLARVFLFAARDVWFGKQI